MHNKIFYLFLIISSFLLSNVYNRTIIDLSAISRDPIIIESDSDFLNYQFSGNGSVINPYLIENLEIGIFGKLIAISNTSKHFVIQNCTLTSGEPAIEIKDIKENTAQILNNDILECDGEGILIINSDGILVQGNTIYYCFNGISLINSKNCTIRENSCTESFAGFYEGGAGIYIQKSQGTKIIQNYCAENEEFGMIIAQSINMTISENIASYNAQGIFIINCESLLIADNDCSYNKYGIYLEQNFYSVIKNNSCINNQNIGIIVSKTNSISIDNNFCIDNFNLGMHILDTTNSTLKENIFFKNNNGLIIASSRDITVSFCNVSKNKQSGIVLQNTTKVLLYANQFILNSLYGVQCDNYTIDCLIYANNFIFNNQQGESQALDDGKNNTWYETETKSGNYWSDVPLISNYKIAGSANSVDKYPLNRPLLDDYEEFDLEKKSTNILGRPHYLIGLYFIFIILLFDYKKKRKKKN